MEVSRNAQYVQVCYLKITPLKDVNGALKIQNNNMETSTIIAIIIGIIVGVPIGWWLANKLLDR